MEGKAFAQSNPWERSFRYDAPIIGLAILILIAGWVMKTTVEGDRTAFHDPDAGFSLEYPSTWTPSDRKGFVFSIHKLRAEGRIKPGLWIEVKEPPSQPDPQIQALVTPLTVDRGRQLFGYRVLSVTETQLDGESAMQIEYAYVDLPPGSATQSSLPVVVRAVDTLILDHDKITIITHAAPEDSFTDYKLIFEGMLNSLELRP
jgi:hypothetical protein